MVKSEDVLDSAAVGNSTRIYGHPLVHVSSAFYEAIPTGTNQYLHDGKTVGGFPVSDADDAETGNDYFGARYYGSTMGRFLSPDYSDTPEAMPYADLSNPQSFNRYVYLNDNPLSGVDTDGHLPNNQNTGQPCDWYGVLAIGSGRTGDKPVPCGAPAGAKPPPPPIKLINPDGSPYTIYQYSFLHIPESGGAGGSSLGPQNAKIGPLDVPPVTIGPSNDGLKIQDCLNQAISGAMQDVMGISLLKDIATAGTTGSLAPLMTPGYAAMGAEHGADAVAGSVGATAAIRAALRQGGIKVSTRAVGKEASLFGQAAGALGALITADTAYEAYETCMAE